MNSQAWLWQRRRDDMVILDPFGFVPGWRSQVEGLGGADQAGYAGYVFHTLYVQSGGGRANFTIRFQDLSASTGSLSLLVNGLPRTPGEAAFRAAELHIPMADLVAAGGEVAIAFSPEPNASFAALAYILDATDARASAVTVTLDRSNAGEQHSKRLIKARRTVFGASPARGLAHLVSRDAATLAEPVSQMCTAAQFAEPQYGEWLDWMRLPPMRHRKQWEFVYILQVLRHHGMLQPGKRGLGFGVGIEPLPAVMAAHGCTVVATDLPPDHKDVADWSLTNQHGMGVENLRRPDICPDGPFDERVSFRPVDMTAPPADLLDFDFTWSSCAYEHLGSIPAGLRFVEDSVNCLKPGGIAVHTTEFNLSSNDRTVDTGSTVLFRRKDIEALALALISQGHEVMPLKYDQGDTPLDAYVDVAPYRENDHLKIALSEFVTTSFGIVVRRGPGA